MGWMQALSETYDNCLSMVGKKDDAGAVLLPIAHLTAQAQAEITIDSEGSFIRAQRVEKESATTIIPVTEGSASRSNGIEPMPLCDKLCYLAKDYSEAEDAEENNDQYYEAYIKKLGEWAADPQSLPQITAVYRYLCKGTVVKDLQASRAYGTRDDFVRFIVTDKSKKVEIGRLWENLELFRNYTDYYSRKLENIDIDYTTGKAEAVAQKLPAKIRNTGDKAKIISSNDKKTNCLTFRGRFRDAAEAVSIGYRSSQKAHNALRWLIEKQGYRNGSEAIISWAVGGERVPDFMTQDVFFGGDSNETIVNTADSYAGEIREAIQGRKKPITPATRVIVMAVDTADSSNQGRLAITYFNEMNGSSFLNNLKNWYESCAWTRYYEKDKGGNALPILKSPIPKDIARAAYGTEQNEILKADDRIIKKCVDRILPCIVQKKRFPRDIMLAVVRNVGETHRYNEKNWERLLYIGCALVRKCYIQKYGREDGEMMELQEVTHNTDRDYCFGRLLAVADHIEERVNYRDKNDRQTNAKKYWSAYSRKPARTFEVIRNNLEPYLEKMKQGERTYFEDMFQQIIQCLAENKGFSNEPLNELYLVGYYCQRAELRKYHKKEEEDNE